MDYEELLNELQGLIGKHLHATLSPATKDGKNVAGFTGILERGAMADFPIVSDDGEQIVFILRPQEGGSDGAHFTLAPSTFDHAVWVDGMLARELVIRTGGVDIALWPTGEES